MANPALDLHTDRIPADQKPTVTGPLDGNVFAVIGACRKALKRAGFQKEAEELSTITMGGQCSSYDEVLALVQCYVNFDL